MKNLTNLELLMEYMEQNQYFIGNDLLAKYNKLLQKEKKEQLTLTDASQQRELLIAFLTDNIHGNLYFTKEVAIKAVDEYLSNL